MSVSEWYLMNTPKARKDLLSTIQVNQVKVSRSPFNPLYYIKMQQYFHLSVVSTVKAVIF